MKAITLSTITKPARAATAMVAFFIEFFLLVVVVT
jgi:hypothetical protein